MYRLTEDLDVKCGKIKQDLDCNYREYCRTTKAHDDLLETNNLKINGVIGQNDYFSTIADRVTKITDLTNLLVQCDEQDKGSMSLVAMSDEQQAKQRARVTSNDSEMKSPTSMGITSRQNLHLSQSPDSQQNLSPIGSPTENKDKTTFGQNKQGMPLISINKKCFNCSGQPSKVIEAFKMSCITYFPSKITYQRRKQTRVELLGHQRAMVNELKIVN